MKYLLFSLLVSVISNIHWKPFQRTVFPQNQKLEHQCFSVYREPSTVHRLPLTAQSDTLPPVEQLFESIQLYYQQVANAELLEYQASQKGEWLKYVPSIGFGFGLGTKEIAGETKVVGKLRPSVSLNTGIIYTAKKDKQLRAAKIKSIESATLLLIQEEQRKLLQLIGNYEQELRALALANEIQEIEEQIFRIQEIKFEQRELTPLQYLPLKRNYLQQRYDLAEKRKGLDLIRGEILVLGRWVE